MAQLFDISTLADCEHSAEFIEGAVLAANLSPKALDSSEWLERLGEVSKLQAVTQHFEKQYVQLAASQYNLLTVLDTANSGLSLEDKLADAAEGFMTIWPLVEDKWDQVITITDGTVRMLQALLTTMMLAIDESLTHQQMKQAGIDEPPSLADLMPQLSMMVTEVALAADEAMLGAKSQRINAYKEVGRNDTCPCNSGKKFKQCCGK